MNHFQRLIYAAQGGNAINDNPHLLRTAAVMLATDHPEIARAARERAAMLDNALRTARGHAETRSLWVRAREAVGRLFDGLARPFQERCDDWLYEICRDDPTDLPERRARFLEEALELVQALNMSREDVEAVVAYTYSRPPGLPFQEFGGTHTTLAALASYALVDLDDAAETELQRVWDPGVMDRIRRKRMSRHGRGPLPGTTEEMDLVPMSDPTTVHQQLGEIGARMGTEADLVPGHSFPDHPRVPTASRVFNGMAEGCCSAIFPCPHQQRDPSTICEVCQKVAEIRGPTEGAR